MPDEATGTVNVICVVTVPVPDGVTVLGENVQGAMIGSSQQVKPIVWLYPFTGVTVMVAVTLPPVVTLSVAGIVRVKVCTGRVTEAEATALFR
jgi:hypothetical protein